EIIHQASAHPVLIGIANWGGIAALALSASFVFAQLQASLNVIFVAPARAPSSSGQSTWAEVRAYLLRRLFRPGVVLSFVFLSIVLFILSAGIAFFVGAGHSRPLYAAHWIGSFAVFTLLFSAIFRWMPDRDSNWRASLWGGIGTSLFFSLG